ncbi:MAG: helix-turn-helix domain-containing protein [Candidatus Margulisbacteria bacterium]|jgi:transcriptional regulator with XRE-family HTH domain|nr:helix-turn-helix domain-containing protein [Candidatus Margulisiibacteriota bacterium]
MPQQDIRKVIGDKLKVIRAKLKYSLWQMAIECGLDYAHYCLIEKGRRYVRLDVLQRISDNLGIAMDFWFRDDAPRFAPVYTKALSENINALDNDKKEFLLEMLTAYRKTRK